MLLLILLFFVTANAQIVELPKWHLTARPWKPLAISKSKYLDVIEGECRAAVKLQNRDGAIIDPYLKRAHQYATPYFAYAVGTLRKAGRAKDLVLAGMLAMDHATEQFGRGKQAIPEEHGEFFLVALTGALELYKEFTYPEHWDLWKKRISNRSALAVKGNYNNWETYRMKGEWMRIQQKLIPRAEGIEIIETAWTERQRKRIADPPWTLYHDITSDPDTLSVEAVGRGNLLAMIAHGYDGPSAAQIKAAVENATASTLLLQDPTGQTPANGRTDDHVWVDIGYQLAFEVMAERTPPELSGMFRRAAMLAFHNIQRWRRPDGSFYVTKNHFDPALRVGYQQASAWTNYNGSLMMHLSEAYLVRQKDVEERPAPSEIGGYTVQLDDRFSSVFANAGGMQIQANLRGDTAPRNGNYWTPLGVVRFSRVGWDSRLGPSDGARTEKGGLTFAPEFFEDGQWKRLADLPERYEAEWSVAFTHPLLVRCSLTYRPKPGQSGPRFRNDFTITPDGVLSEVRKISDDNVQWAVTWPVLVNDGRALEITRSARMVSTGFKGSTDRENFLALNKDAKITDGETMRSTYGDLTAMRMITNEPVSRTFVYPQSVDDPKPESILSTFRVHDDGFASSIHTVKGRTYEGRYSAGGVGQGALGVQLPEVASFFMQVAAGKPVAIETDRDIQIQQAQVKSFTPYRF